MDFLRQRETSSDLYVLRPSRLHFFPHDMPPEFTILSESTFYKDLLEREVKKIVLVLVFYPNCVYILYSFLQKAQGTYIYGLNYSCFMSAHLKGQSEKSLFTLLLSYGVVVSLPADDFTLIWINIHKSQYVTINACSIPKRQTSRSLSWTGYITVQLVSSKIH